jgi:hypothetical protein
MKANKKSQPSPKNIGFLRGSLIQLRRRCGKPNCRCAKGQPHASPALSYSEKGKTRILTLRAEDVPTVRAALDRYHRAQGELEREAASGVLQLKSLLKRPG